MTVIERINKYMTENNCKKIDVSRMADIPYTTIDGLYKKGTDNIKLSTLNKLKNLIGCTLDELVYNDSSIDQNTSKLSQNETSLLSDYRKLNADGQDKVNEYTKDLTGNPQYALPSITAIHTEETRDIFSDPTVAMAASGLTATSELSDHNKDVILKAYNKMKKGKKD